MVTADVIKLHVGVMMERNRKHTKSSQLILSLLMTTTQIKIENSKGQARPK